MIAPEEEVIIDISTSCTKDVAVAKLLGWAQGPIFPRHIQVAEHGISRLDLGHLSAFDAGIQRQLEEIHLGAQNRLVKAAEGDWKPDQLQSLEAEIHECRDLILRASDYFLAIDDELAKGESSELRIHDEATLAAGVTHITLRSLESWGLKQLQVDIRPAHRRAQPSPTLAQPDPTPWDSASDKKYTGLQVTFAFLVDAFLAHAPAKFRRPDDKINVSALAQELSKLAKAANNKDGIKGQSLESIKTRIEQAERARRGELPARTL